jgi:hypothetical protein
MNCDVLKNRISYVTINKRMIMKAETIICLMGFKKPTKTSFRIASA